MTKCVVLAVLSPPESGGSGILALCSNGQYHLFIISSEEQLTKALDSVLRDNPLDRFLIESKLHRTKFAPVIDPPPLVHLQGAEAETIGNHLLIYCAYLEKHGALPNEREREYSRIRAHLLPRTGTGGAGILAIWNFDETVYVYYSLEGLRRILSSIGWIDEEQVIRLHEAARAAGIPEFSELRDIGIYAAAAEPIARALELSREELAAPGIKAGNNLSPHIHD